jgi:hypothetical protein
MVLDGRNDPVDMPGLLPPHAIREPSPMTTFRQIRANQKNAEKSTGPITEVGKARSRGNALKHGLTGDGVVLTDEQEEAVRQRMESWRGNYNPVGEQDEWLYRQVIVSTVKIDQCQAEEPAVRAELATRATSCWDDDRRLDADELGARLAADPARVRGRLLRTAQGCQWLIDRWDVLGQTLLAQNDDDNAAWTEEQEALALDLLGVAPELRIPGRTAWQMIGAASPSGLVMRELQRLEKIRDEALLPLDELERSSAEAGRVVGAVASTAPAKALERLRRQEAASWRRFLWARGQLLSEHRTSRPTPPSPPAPAQPAAPATSGEGVAAASKRTHCDTGMTLPPPVPETPASDRTVGLVSSIPAFLNVSATTIRGH